MIETHTQITGIVTIATIVRSFDPKVHVRYCHHLVSIVSSINFNILIFFSGTTSQFELEPNFVGMLCQLDGPLRSLCLFC
jgi:hypothetical protein